MPAATPPSPQLITWSCTRYWTERTYQDAKTGLDSGDFAARKCRVWVWAYYALLIGVTAAPAGWRARAAAFVKERLTATAAASGLAVVALLAWTAVPFLPDGRLHVTVLNVEGGSSVLVVTPGGARILVDGEPRASTTLSQLGQRLPWWDKRLDLVILSSPSPERLGGLLGVLERYDVGVVIVNGQDPGSPAYAQLVALLAARGIRHEAATETVLRTGDGVTFTLLNAAKDEGQRTKDDDALIVHIAYGRVSFLLPSDITAKRETELAQRVPPATVLLAGRGGAKDATSQAWLDAVGPSAVVISVQPDARTVLPDPEVLNRLVFYPVWRTDEVGTVEWVTDGTELSVQGTR